MRTVDTVTIARALGWFSLALGAAQLVAPRAFTRSLGARDRPGLVRTAYGLREIVAGVGILTRPDPTPWLWARVAGDVLDLATLGNVHRSIRADHPAVRRAMVGVALVTAVDVACAARLSARS